MTAVERVVQRRIVCGVVSAFVAAIAPARANAQATAPRGPAATEAHRAGSVVAAFFSAEDGPYRVEAEPAPGAEPPPAANVEHRCAPPCHLELPAGWWRVDAIWSDGTRRTELVEIGEGRDVTRALQRPARDQPILATPTVTRVARGLTIAGGGLVGASLLTAIVILATAPPATVDRGPVISALSVTASVAAVGTTTTAVGLLLNPFFEERPPRPAPRRVAALPLVRAGRDALYVGVGVRF